MGGGWIVEGIFWKGAGVCVCVCIGFSRFFSILSLNYLVENEIREELNRVTMIESNVKLVDVLFFFFLFFRLVSREGNF